MTRMLKRLLDREQIGDKGANLDEAEEDGFFKAFKLQKKFQSLTVVTQIAWKFVGFMARSSSFRCMGHNGTWKKENMCRSSKAIFSGEAY
ncbi:uncharacterized protein LOC131315012 isoform X2 [Rhododendron vialii]|uniref:uncharacterized protein LOC131315012 isoform X2 n=1 Tax=Rhododendron vialii TaxID=182163 RepID=UPI00265DF6BE|nr:uncharacterized protein LOC131315012 isoform X2 [Rhododendron vialii]